jgi:4-hydroxythreonine-4-phosphate dehydrogenase
MTDSLPLALTLGDPAGVGPELVALAAQRNWPLPLLAIGDCDRLQQAAQERGVPLQLLDSGPPGTLLPALPAGQLHVRHIPSPHPAQAGKLDPANAAAVLAMIDAAADGALRGHFRAVITAPVHKGIINDAGHPFSGHTERLAERAGAEVLMLLVADKLRVALVTTHVPLRAVAELITAERVELKLRLLQAGLQRWFGIEHPALGVLGLNPHAGEGGHMGDEEQRILLPLLQRLQREGMRLTGPLPADTAFVPRADGTSPDAFLAMYHDQGLPVLKYAGFGHAVNVTLGLPYLRTSVDHGTALDIAGRGLADPGSLIAALQLAMDACDRPALPVAPT